MVFLIDIERYDYGSIFVNIGFVLVVHIVDGPFLDFYRRDLAASILEKTREIKRKAPQ